MNHLHLDSSCGCCSKFSFGRQSAFQVSRRNFLAGTTSLALSGTFSPFLRGTSLNPSMDRAQLAPIRNPVTVQPVLTFHIPQKKEATSWREWGGLMTEAIVIEEKNRVQKELSALSSSADFPLKVLPLAAVETMEEAASVANGQHDVLLTYAAGGSTRLLEALTNREKWRLMFLRHRSGPVYLWYEIVHPRYLRKTVDEFGQPGMDIEDVVVDKPEEVLWRLRALQGLLNTMGKRIVAVGGAGGWGEGGAKAPERAHELWKMDLSDFPYSELGRRIQNARGQATRVKQCRADAENYLRQDGVTLATSYDFVANAFLLADIFKDLMAEAKTDSITINSCMNTIMPMSQTTACLALSLLNDAGYMAFCESDFVVIPSGVLLHYLSGKPVFLNDPTYPHDQLVTLAHCTAPRKMDGIQLEAAKIMTHFESDYGAAPKVEMRVGQAVTNLIPDFASRHWVGFLGTIVTNPNLDICRSQIDVMIHGDQSQLLQEMKGFHWMTCYGNYLKETGYAIKKVGVGWHDLSTLQNPSKDEGRIA